MRGTAPSPRFALGVIAAFLAALVSCQVRRSSQPADDDVYTLYRDSALVNGQEMRIHVATFDAVDGESYNRENCQIGQGLFQNQPGVTVRYWCEKGRFRK